MTDEEIKQAVEEAANEDIGAKYGLTKKEANMTPEEIKQASDDMTQGFDAMDKKANKKFTSDRMKQLGRFLNAPIMSTVNELATPDYDKERYTEQAMGTRNHPVKDTVRDVSYAAGTVAADDILSKQIVKQMDKLGFNVASPREMKQKEKNEHQEGILKEKILDAQLNNNPAKRDDGINELLSLTLNDSSKAKPKDMEAVLTTYQAVPKGLNILKDSNTEYQNKNIINPSRKNGFISSIIDSVKLAQLKNNSDKIDIERIKKELPVNKLDSEQQQQFQAFLDNGDDKGLEEWLLSASTQNSLQK